MRSPVLAGEASHPAQIVPQSTIIIDKNNILEAVGHAA
jgi:hypothetical protein